MPKATDEQRRAFADALTEAMRKRGEALTAGLRLDEWLAGQVGQSPQAIRNYLAAIREPRNGAIVERIEDALEVERHALGQHLGYGPGVYERVSHLEATVETLETKLGEVLELLQELGQRDAPREPHAP